MSESMPIYDATFAELAKHLSFKPEIVEEGAKKFIVTKDGYERFKFEDYPDRIAEKVQFSSKLAFIDYLKMFNAGGPTLVFPMKGEYTNFVLHCIFDYHGEEPENCSHKATLNLSLDEDWKQWQRMSGQSVSQREMANFFMDYKDDFVSPDGGNVMQIIQTLRTQKDSKIESRISDFSEGVDSNKSINISSVLNIPEYFEVSLPIFETDAKWSFKFRLMMRTDSNDKVMLSISLIRPSLVEKCAFEAIMADVSSAGIKVLGTPEGVKHEK